MSNLAPKLRDAALEAIALFLHTSGLSVPASTLDTVRYQLHKDSTTAVSDAKKLLLELKPLVASLARISSAFDGATEGTAERLAPFDSLCADFGIGSGQQVKRPGACLSDDNDRSSKPAFASLVARPSLQLAQESMIPSAHYVLHRCADQPDLLKNHDPCVPEQYRDDHDPGYRIQEVSEAELTRPRDQGPAQLTAPVAAVTELHTPPPDPTAACFCSSVGTGLGGGDDDELFNAGETPTSLRNPITPRSLSGIVKDAGSAMLAALGVGTLVDPHALRADAAGNAVRRRVGVGASSLTSHRHLSLADAVSHAGPTAPLAAERGAPSVLAAAAAPSPAFGGEADDAPTFGTPEVAPQRPVQAAPRAAGRHPDSGDPFYPVEAEGVVYDSFSLRVVYERGKTGFEESKEFPFKADSVVAARFRMLEYLGSASFSYAVKCLDLHTNQLVCMKIIKNDKDTLDQSLDEIKLLRIIKANADSTDAKCCLDLIDYFYFKEHLIIVTELLRENLYDFSRLSREQGDPPYFTMGHLQILSRQVLTALDYIHSLSLIHADLKPENILMKSHSKCEVKLIDFGSSCFVGDYLTSYVQSRSYRAPEVILGLDYDQKIDIWSLGCVIAELWSGYMLFQNDSIQSLLARMISIMGPFPAHMLASGKQVSKYFTQDGRLYQLAEPAAEAGAFPALQQRRAILLLPKRSSLRQRMRTEDERFIDFLSNLLKLDPAERLTAPQALRHPWLARGLYSDGI
mmetsp:Transcript_23909/g.68401  ORF Transcript_23909/g.68401 Transcript_23909/m.68401 type:complete len:743 (-) Transcript_23909:223-2451(-)